MILFHTFYNKASDRNIWLSNQQLIQNSLNTILSFAKFLRISTSKPDKFPLEL